ncbi:TatD family hydrolase [Mangrovivirga sp. M17]|uniref:TatD family hydrolase n=1 Tax=Mangrovivirga halotolerans TaxID=2993936 RepID=A0ABT3RLT7_9BACT|nr:TatD family hydrolase [Mangrovivirga halotolerans]MCX2742546.1 TatD family hydrolase [Mangrovivirga halotolerans]
MNKPFNIHSHNFPSDNLKDQVIYQVMAHEYDSLPDLPYMSIGIHPWHFEDQKIEDQWAKIEKWATSENVVAIGESGLDYAIDQDRKLQEEIFIRHIELSEQTQKPLIIHCVKAHNELVRVRKKTRAKQQWIVHGVNQKLKSLTSLLERDIILSFGKALLEEKSNARKVIRELGMGSFLFETDDEENSMINSIYKEAANILDKNEEQIKKEIGYLCTEIFDI